MSKTNKEYTFPSHQMLFVVAVPLLVWEPSNQAVIQRTAQIYLGGKPAAKGLRFAINISPERFKGFCFSFSFSFFF